METRSVSSFWRPLRGAGRYAYELGRRVYFQLGLHAIIWGVMVFFSFHEFVTIARRTVAFSHSIHLRKVFFGSPGCFDNTVIDFLLL
jgi:hypothetical protein